MNELFIKRGIYLRQSTKGHRRHTGVPFHHAPLAWFSEYKRTRSPCRILQKGGRVLFFAGRGKFITGAGVRRFPGPVRRLYTGGFPDFAAFVGDPGKRGCRVSLRGVSPLETVTTRCAARKTRPVRHPSVCRHPSAYGSDQVRGAKEREPDCCRTGKHGDSPVTGTKTGVFCKTGRSCGRSVRVCKDPESGALRKSGCPAGSQTSSAVYMKIGSGNQSFAKSGSRSRSGE